jgi:transcription termination/antitermination protein NusG
MMRWYVVQVYAGYEELAKADIEKRIAQQGLHEDFGQVFIPSVKLKQFFVEDAADQQLFPGYILIEMNMKPETHRLVSGSLRVLKFLGGKDPVPLSRKEIDRILSQMKGEIAVGVEKQELFTIGSEIEISDGPFASFVGVVDSVDMENEKLTVMVSIFGRMTPVELGFNQVKR